MMSEAYKTPEERYKGMYTAEEVELNNRLYEECMKDEPDFALIEELLCQGADPLGATAVEGYGISVHVYGEIAAESQDNLSKNVPAITELFLKHGMDIDHPRIPYDDGDSQHPMWDFAFAMNKNSICALRMLLDNGLSWEAAAKMWDHAVVDMSLSEFDPENDEFWNYQCIWLMKHIMLCASYDHIINADEVMGEFICLEHNDYDLHKFRQWNDYIYHFDTSFCGEKPGFIGAVVHISDAVSGKEVWTMGIGEEIRQILYSEN